MIGDIRVQVGAFGPSAAFLATRRRTRVKHSQVPL